MKKSTRYSPEVRERAVRMVLEHQAGYDSQWAAIVSVASKLGCTAETLRKWVRRAEGEAGLRPGPKSEEDERLKALERENRELRRANEILRKAAAFFRPGGDRPPRDVMVSFIDTHRRRTGVEPICRELPIAPSTYYESKAREAGRAPVRRERDVTRSCGRRSGGCGRRTSGCTGCARYGVRSTGRAFR